MTEEQKFGGFCDAYLKFFAAAGCLASIYIGITNHHAHQGSFNKVLIVFILLTVVTALMLVLPLQIKLNMTLMHFALLVGIFLVNAFLELPLKDLFKAAHHIGVRYDPRNKWEVIRDYKKQGITAYPSAFFSAFAAQRGFFEKTFNIDFDQLLPLSGVSHVQTVLCNENGPWVSYKSDKYGFNNDDSVYSDTRATVMLVGDSFTQGICVQRGEDIAGNLRRRGYKAISLGTGGNGPLIDLALMKEYGPQLTPKIILWMYYEGNNFAHVPDEYRFSTLKKYLEPGYTQNLVRRQDEVDRFWIDFYGKSEKYMMAEHGRSFWNHDRGRELKGLILRLLTLHNIRDRLGVARNSYIFDNASGVSDDETEREFREIMTEARAQAERLGSKMYFVYLPSFNSLIDDKYTLAPDSQRVRKVVSELGIPLIDFYAYLKATKDPAAYFPFHEGGHHYNPQGYDLLADLVESSVLKASIPKTGNL